MAYYVVIVAGGKGLRMGGDLPKQFMPLCGKPVLMHTIEKFHTSLPQAEIIVVLPREQHAFWQKLCSSHQFSIVHRVAEGGETRFHSVKNGLSLIPRDVAGYVAIHDGVRPFVSTDTILRCFDGARQSGAAIPIMPVIETLRHRDGHNVERSNYQIVQTPQVFDIELLKKSYQKEYQPSFTDDASVVEADGNFVTAVEGNRENIKLTTPFDMLVGEALLAR